MSASASRPLRVLFVNTGIMGHGSVARLFRDSVPGDAGIQAVHVDLAAELTVRERAVRRLLTLGPRPGTLAGARTAARFRHELDAGLRAAHRIRRLERAGESFDVIHFHTQAAAWGSLRRMRATPAIVSIDATQRLLSLNLPAGTARRDYVLGAARDRRVFRAAAAVVATSRWAADDVARDLPECASRLRVMPYPVALDDFGRGWSEERRARPPADPVRVLYIGGLFELKGGPELLAAWGASGLAGRAALTLVTDSRAVDPAALPPGVSLRRGVRAYTPEWRALWREADVFAMPTRVDAFGMVFQEAAAAGLPAIGTTVNAVPELVADGETGVLVPPGDVGALVEALRRLVESAGTRHRMGAEARRRVEAGGSVASYGARLVELIHEVA
ncbi:MAG TPA: glycosyltransferase family 4 protein, partial [Longimicrobiaceae bacterium]|nr:glycosyltransferase family 4 protein [Longimicrobiaceae bacterium]